MKLLIMQFSPASYYSPLFGLNILLSHSLQKGRGTLSSRDLDK
jgi:hypothetical protein